MKKKKKIRLKSKLLRNIFSLIVLAVVILAIVEVLKLGILPDKYLYLFLGGEGLLFLLGFFLYNRRNKVLMVFGIIFYLISIFGNIFGYYYLSKINNYVDTSFKKEYFTIKTTYYVVASKNDTIESTNELSKDSNILYYKYSKSIDKALKSLGKYNYTETDSVLRDMIQITTDNKYLLISKANYDYFFDSINIDTANKDDYKIIDEFDVYEKVVVNNKVKDSYNIYINGLDFTGVMRDYNLIVTVNTKTKKVVLTSIPRDYYIDVPAYKMKDTLMCLGSLDSEVSKEALEKLFNIEIDYTINLNTTSLVDVVDSIGGVEFCSDYDFTTTHALVLDTYNDKGKNKLHVSKGCDTYNGLEILAIARERNAFPGRDRYRQKNCRQILINIVKKLASTTTLTNYDDILSSFEGLYTTDMNDKAVKKLIKTALNDPNFEIIEQSVDGVDGIGIGHLGTQESWIITPDMNTVNDASKQIKKVLNEK